MNRIPAPLFVPALCALSFIAPAAFSPAAAASTAPAVESTARIDLSVEPPIPAVAAPLVVNADEKPVLIEGKATPTAYNLYSFKPPAGRMFELRLFAPEDTVAMSVFRGASTTAESGAGPDDRAVMWMSSVAEGEELRILVRGRVAGETPFKLGAKLFPKIDSQD